MGSSNPPAFGHQPYTIGFPSVNTGLRRDLGRSLALYVRMSRLARAWARGACAGAVVAISAIAAADLQASLLRTSIQEPSMLELRYPPAHQIDEQHLVAVRQVIAEVLEAKEQRGNRAGNQAIIDKIGLDARLVHDEDFWGEALDYHLGLLYAHIGEPEKAAEHFERSQTHPGHGGNQVFDGHLRESVEYRRRQELARQRGMPSPVIAAMPRSASASLTQTLATILDAPLMRASCGRFPNFYLVPRWLNSFFRGGAVLHDHFGAVPYNLRTLRDVGVRRVFVRVRDPRPAAASAISLSNRKFGTSDNIDHERQVIRLCEQAFIPWVADWLAAAADPATGVKIHWLAQPSHAIPEMARDVLTALAPDYPALEPYLRADVAEVRANFVSGDAEAWREGISKAGQEQLWAATPESVKEFLALRP
jgi:hypothetical protein